jgi:hypothetical protein
VSVAGRRMRRSLLPLLIAGLGVALVACAAPLQPGDQETAATDRPTASISRPPFATMPPLDSGPVPSGDVTDVPDAAWQAVLGDLSNRVGRTIDDPTVVMAGAVTYNDGSLGCPEPGQTYTQALVDGYRVVLEVDGEEYDYRIGRSSTAIKLCESGSIPRASPDA